MYKIGEKILVRNSDFYDWQERIYIKKGTGNSVICVMEEYEEAYLQGRSFVTCLWWQHKPVEKSIDKRVKELEERIEKLEGGNYER